MIWQKKVYIPLIIIILAIVIVTPIVILARHHDSQPEITVKSSSTSVIITNKDQYSDTLTDFPYDTFQHDITVLVRTYKKSTPNSITTTIRDKSFTENTVENTTSTSFTIDIPQQKLSFGVVWNRTDAGTTEDLFVNCLDKDKLIYGTFGCHDTSLL